MMVMVYVLDAASRNNAVVCSLDMNTEADLKAE